MIYRGKVFQRSRKRNRLTLLRSMFSYQKSVLLMSDIIMEYILRKAAWLHVIPGVPKKVYRFGQR